jgi:hypothetical protein
MPTIIRERNASDGDVFECLCGVVVLQRGDRRFVWGNLTERHVCEMMLKVYPPKAPKVKLREDIPLR